MVQKVAVKSTPVVDMLSINGDSLVVSLAGGQHVAQAVTAGTAYEIDSDIDVYVKSSGEPAVVGWDSDNTDAIWAQNRSFAAIDAWDFGTDAFTYEFFGTVEADVTNDPRPFMMGVAGNALFAPRVEVDDSTGEFHMRVVLTDNAGANVLGTATFSTGDISGTGPSTDLHHFIWVFDRPNEIVTVYMDGVPYYAESYTDSGGTLNFSDINTAVAEVVVGGTPIAAPVWNGKHYAHRFYKQALSPAQVAARTNAGPARLAQDGVIPSAILNFSSYSRWANVEQPEMVVGTTADGQIVEGSTFLTLDGLKNAVTTLESQLAVYPGSAPASTANSKRIKGGRPQTVLASGDFLNLYSAPTASGDVILTPVG